VKKICNKFHIYAQFSSELMSNYKYSWHIIFLKIGMTIAIAFMGKENALGILHYPSFYTVYGGINK